MNKHQRVPIEWPYQSITIELDMTPMNRRFVHADILYPDMWDALAKAERSMHPRDPGCHGWTDVNVIEDSMFIRSIWDHVALCYESGDMDWDGYSESAKTALVARRVAQTIALMTFGAEILLR